MKIVNRVKANEDFAYAVKKGSTVRNNSYVIHFIKNNKELTRVGISVSTKLGHAVTRNRVKRQIRAMCDSLINYASHTFDVVIVVKQNFLDNDYQNNLQLLNLLLSKIGITK